MSILDTIKAAAKNPTAGMASSYEVLPVGRYQFVVERAEERPYIDGCKRDNHTMSEYVAANPGVVPGKEISFVFRIVDGPYAGRKLSWNATVLASSNQRTYGNFSPRAKEEAGVQEIVALTKRCELKDITQWIDFVGCQFKANVTHTKSKTDPDKTFENINMRIRDGEDLAVQAKKTSVPAVSSDEPPF